MKAVLKIALAMIIWGSLGIVVRMVELPSIEISFFRALITGIVLLAIRLKFIKGKLICSKKDLAILASSGAVLGLNWILLFNAYRYTTVANATVSYYIAPVIAVIIARLLLGERLSLRKKLSMVVSMLGLLTILLSSSQVEMSNTSHFSGIMFGASAALFYAIVMVVNKYVKNVSSIDKTLIQVLSATMVLLPVVVARNNIEITNFNTVSLLLVIGIVHTCIPYLIYFSNIEKVSMANSAVLSYLDPFAAVLFGHVLLNEPLTNFHLLGGFLILVSIYLNVGERKSAKSKYNLQIDRD